MGLAGRASGLTGWASSLAGRQGWLAGPQAWLDGPEGGGQTDVWTDVRTENLPIYQTLSPIGAAVKINVHGPGLRAGK